MNLVPPRDITGRSTSFRGLRFSLCAGKVEDFVAATAPKDFVAATAPKDFVADDRPPLEALEEVPALGGKKPARGAPHCLLPPELLNTAAREGEWSGTQISCTAARAVTLGCLERGSKYPAARGVPLRTWIGE